MDRVVISGATSMIGVALIKECIKNRIEVFAIVRKNSVHIGRLPKSELIKVYECELDQLQDIECNKSYDVFYHLAWEGTNKKDRSNAVVQEKNIAYTLQATKLAYRLGCRKFIGAGSQAEYGQVNGVISPQTNVVPITAYGIAKYAAGKLSEKLCMQYGIIHVWARVFSVYGSLDNEETMLNYAMRCFRKHEVAQFSAATQMWDYLYEEDAGRVFFLLGEYIEDSKIYCVANGNARPLREYIMELKKIWGEDAKCEFAIQDKKSSIGLQADISDLTHDIHYVPSTTFETGISKVIKIKKDLCENH